MKKKTKKSYIKDQYPKDSIENDKYLLKLRELAKNHPEIIPEYKNFCTYQAGFTNGVLHQIENYILMAEEMKDLKEQKRKKNFTVVSSTVLMGFLITRQHFLTLRKCNS